MYIYICIKNVYFNDTIITLRKKLSPNNAYNPFNKWIHFSINTGWILESAGSSKWRYSINCNHTIIMWILSLNWTSTISLYIKNRLNTNKTTSQNYLPHKHSVHPSSNLNTFESLQLNQTLDDIHPPYKTDYNRCD